MRISWNYYQTLDVSVCKINTCDISPNHFNTLWLYERRTNDDQFNLEDLCVNAYLKSVERNSLNLQYYSHAFITNQVHFNLNFFSFLSEHKKQQFTLLKKLLPFILVLLCLHSWRSSSHFYSRFTLQLYHQLLISLPWSIRA